MTVQGKPLAARAAELAQQMPLRAAGFIVTLYGDVVVPRGGEVWIGNIISACALVGISETLVRTAVSRLVAAGQLEGRREGRRSFYRLTEAASAEFAEAARIIYGPPSEPGWRFVWLPEAGAEAAMAQLERSGHARLKPQLAIGLDSAPLPAGALGFAAQPEGATGLLRDFAAAHFDLQSHAAAYRDFATRFALPGAAKPAGAGDGAAALALRLLMVHAWRQTLLRDPRLPDAALPADWPAPLARAVFARSYLALSDAADSHVAASFQALSGALARESAPTRNRLAALQAVHADAKAPEAIPKDKDLKPVKPA